jgi:hypothetical protein
MFHLPLFLSLCLSLLGLTSAASVPLNFSNGGYEVESTTASNCFPALGFKMPSEVPQNSQFSSWWCKPENEHAFMGFSYEVTACERLVNVLVFRSALLIVSEGQSKSQLISEFKDIRSHFNSRYVRLYGACDRDGF